MKRSLVLLLPIFLSSCVLENNIPKPNPLLDEQVYIDIFYELELLSIYQDRGTNSSVIDSLNEEIFKKYDTDEDLFKTSHEYYQSQIIEQQKRVDTVLLRVNKEIELFAVQDSLKGNQN